MVGTLPNQTLRTADFVRRPENLRRSVDCINAALRGTKKMDLFECARVATDVPVEEVIKTLSELIKEGKFDHIGMSECKAETLRRANSVSPISELVRNMFQLTDVVWH